MLFGHLYVFYGEMSCHLDLLPTFGFDFFFFFFFLDVELHELFEDFGEQSLVSHFLCKYFLPFHGLPFGLFMIFFAVQKLLSLIRSHLFVFVFIFIILGGGSKKILLQLMKKSVLLIFSLYSFVVSGLTFSSLIHFEFIFVYDVRECSNFILL